MIKIVQGPNFISTLEMFKNIKTFSMFLTKVNLQAGVGAQWPKWGG